MKKCKLVEVYFESDNLSIKIGNNLEKADIIIKGNGTIMAIFPNDPTDYYIFAK